MRFLFIGLTIGLISGVILFGLWNIGCIKNFTLERVSPDFYGYWKREAVKEGEIYKIRIWPTKEYIALMIWEKDLPKDKIYFLKVSYYSIESNIIKTGEYELFLNEGKLFLRNQQEIVFERILLKE